LNILKGGCRITVPVEMELTSECRWGIQCKVFLHFWYGAAHFPRTDLSSQDAASTFFNEML